MRLLRRVAAGAKAGLLAGAGVAVFFLVVDAVQLRPLATPVGLASGLLGGSAARVDPGLIASVAAGGGLLVRILAYTLLHLLAFAAVGVTSAFVLRVDSFGHALLGGGAYGSLVCTGLLYAGRWLVDFPVALDTLGLPSVLLANAMAGTILGLVLHLAESDPAVAGT